MADDNNNGNDDVFSGTSSSENIKLNNNNDNNDLETKIVIGDDTRKEFLKRICCINMGRDLCVMLLLFFSIIILFGGLSDMFDWEINGFWSLHGGTQALGSFILLSYLFIGIWQVFIGLQLNGIQPFTRHISQYKNLNDDENEQYENSVI